MPGGLDGTIVGFLHVKRFLAAGQGGTDEPLLEAKTYEPWCERAMVVPEQARLDRVLERFRVEGAGRAVCVDERGSVTGMIRGADIVDEAARGDG